MEHTIHFGKTNIQMMVDQVTIDGLCALIHFIKGMEREGHGNVPGCFELIMHFRSLKDAIHKANQQDGIV